jgi:hypothetical protein
MEGTGKKGIPSPFHRDFPEVPVMYLYHNLGDYDLGEARKFFS